MTDALYAVFAAVIWQNVVVTGLLGLTPFLAERGASYARSATVGLCATVIMAIAVLVTAALSEWLLEPAGAAEAVLLVFAGVVLAIGAGGALVSRSASTKSGEAPRWRRLLPEALLDAALIGGAIIAMGAGETIGMLTVEAVAAGLGFTAILLVMEGIRERLAWLRPSSWVAGIPIQLITLGILALILSGFEGI